MRVEDGHMVVRSMEDDGHGASALNNDIATVVVW